jgi:TonB family protein
MSTEDFSLDKSSSFSGDVIRINTDATVSTAEILSQAPIDLKRGTGGIGRQNPFDQIAAGNASALDLETKSASIGSEAIQVKETAPVDVGKDAASSGAQQSGFTISGDLTRADILKYQMPGFPSWAKQKGLSNVNVTISISVDASGNVQPTMIVRRSSGYPQWDDSVKSALRGWKFKPSEGGTRRGSITFTFILR